MAGQPLRCYHQLCLGETVTIEHVLNAKKTDPALKAELSDDQWRTMGRWNKKVNERAHSPPIPTVLFSVHSLFLSTVQRGKKRQVLIPQTEDKDAISDLLVATKVIKKTSDVEEKKSKKSKKSKKRANRSSPSYLISPVCVVCECNLKSEFPYLVLLMGTWKEIQNYADKYEISSLGNAKQDVYVNMHLNIMEVNCTWFIVWLLLLFAQI